MEPGSTIATICKLAGIRPIAIQRLSGGDINHAYKIATATNPYFVKINSAITFPQMFAKEMDGLATLRNKSLLKVPDVIAVGETEGQQYLILEWLERAEPTADDWKLLGKGLAELHAQSNPHFGYTSDNYIGSLIQANNQVFDWPTFYGQKRIMPLVQKLTDQKKLLKDDLTNAEKTCDKLGDIFPDEQPSLLHGDLWSGNIMFSHQGAGIKPALFDPAVYYGHREMDIGMTLLFGGFDTSFYNAYNDAFPLLGDWQQRVTLTQLYPLLVHAILFGGSYINRCRSKLRQWS